MTATVYSNPSTGPEISILGSDGKYIEGDERRIKCEVG